MIIDFAKLLSEAVAPLESITAPRTLPASPDRSVPKLTVAETMSLFHHDTKGNMIGYHWQPSQQMYADERPDVDYVIRELTMESLEDRILFIAPNPDDWNADHICLQQGYPLGITYRILFRPKFICVAVDPDSYADTYVIQERPQIAKGKHCYLSAKGEKLRDSGVDFIAVGNPNGDISESFLLDPRKTVVAIEKL